MTEDDARRLAKHYGMDYDSFIATYILGGSTPPTVTNVTNTPDSSTENITNIIVAPGDQTQPVVENEIVVDRSPCPNRIRIGILWIQSF